MGGRGVYSSSGGFTSYEYEAEEDRIGGYKVIHNKEHQNKGLPEYSNSPNTIYFWRGDKGYIGQMRVYDSHRRSHISIEWNHAHDGIPPGTAHIQKYRIGPNGHPERYGKAARLSRYYIKKYGDLLKEAFPDIKF